MADRLFCDSAADEAAEVHQVAEGAPLPYDAALVRARETGAIFLIDVDPRPGHGTQRVKRPIAGPEAARRYRLRDWDDPTIPVAPASVLDELRTGPGIE